MRAPRLLGVAAGAAVSLSACGISDPYHAAGGSQSRLHVAPGAPPGRDHDGPPRPRKTMVVTGASPQGSLRRYASIYLNWNASNVVAEQQQLVTLSLGQARGQAQLAA